MRSLDFLSPPSSTRLHINAKKWNRKPHVQIINKVDEFLATVRTKVLPTTLFQDAAMGGEDSNCKPEERNWLAMRGLQARQQQE